MPRPRVVLPRGGMPGDGGGHGEYDASIINVPAVQQLAERLHLPLHLPAVVLELRDDAAVAPPDQDDEEARRDECPGRDNEPRPVHAHARPSQERGVEQEECDREDREGLHRTGWRRAGRTMNGAFGTAPRRPSVSDSSSTCAPRNFTT